MKTSHTFEYAVDLCNVSVQRAHLMVLENITCAIPKSKISAIIGPNGAGKTTLLHAIMKFIPLAKGSCTILGSAIEQIREKVAYVPQKSGVEWDFPATVEDVVLMGRFVHYSWWQSLTKDDYEHVYQALAAVDMLMYKHRPIGELSGGQQQRVFIARALAQNPEIYFLDEPFAGVDLATEQSIMHILHGERDKGKSIVMVHHDLHSLYEYADWALLLNKGVIKVGSVGDVLHKDVIMQAYGRNNFLMDRS